MKKIQKKITIAIGVISIIFGIINFLLGLGNMPSDEVQKLNAPLPISGTKKIYIDDYEQIYLYNNQNRSLQIFDYQGNFKTGYIFPTMGGDMWVYGSNNYLYLYSIRRKTLYTVYECEVVRNQNINYKAPQDFYNQYDVVDKQYPKVRFSIYNRSIDIDEKEIILKAPIFPLSFEYSIIAVALGSVMILCVCFDKLYEYADRKY